jgi:hypothetical protein
MVLQFLENVHCPHAVQLKDQWVLGAAFELVTVREDNKETLESHLHCFVVFHTEEVDIVSDDSCGSIEVKDAIGVSRVSHVREDVAYLALHVVAVHIE